MMIFSGFLLVIGYGCSKDEEKKEPQEVVTADEKDSADESAAAAPEPAPEQAVSAPAPEPVAAPEPAKAAPAASASVAGFNAGNYLFVKRAGLSVRAAPGKSSKAVAKLDYGTKVTVLAKEGTWIKIRENEWVLASGLTTQYQYVNKDH
jgi:uncharacterized protein YgiM (DUF1202 family)